MNYFEKGDCPWTDLELKDSISEFIALYDSRTFDLNVGGMNAPHMFGLWFLLKKINPAIVIENGVWKGQGTWLIRNSLKKAEIHSLDPNLHFREIVFDEINYSSTDFGKHLWKEKIDVSKTLAFFDDHQNALERIRQCKEAGIKHIIFEDNYPPGTGDCYSPKMIYGKSGFSPKSSGIKDASRSFKGRLRKLLGRSTHQYLHFPEPLNEISPNDEDFAFFDDVVKGYHEFPPTFRTEETRNGENWKKQYPKPEPLFDKTQLNEKNRIFLEQADTYTWICYLELY